MLWLGMCGEFLQLLLGCLYMGVTGATIISMLRKMSACVTQKEKEATGSPSRESIREKTMPMRTYAFCVLQTFHRLCKTSESVRPLESWEEGRKV